MNPETRVSIDDDFVSGLSCAICGAEALEVVHLREYPDFVRCVQCQSAFVVEHGGRRVMYGKIADTFPGARHSLLRQWNTYEDIRRLVASSRAKAGAPPVPSTPTEEQAEAALLLTPGDVAALPSARELPPEKQVPAVAPVTEAELPTPGVPGADVPSVQAILSDLVAQSQEPLGGPHVVPVKEPEEPIAVAGQPAFQEVAAVSPPALPPEQPAAVVAATEETASPQPVPISQPPGPREQPTPEEPTAPAEGRIPTGDPSPGQRWRVVIRGGQLRIPLHICAHCLRSPVHGRLRFPILLPTALPGRRHKSAVDIPLCAQCQKRTKARGRERRDALTLVHMLSAMASLLLLVAAVWLNLADFSRGPGLALMILGGLALAGYMIPLALLIPWANRFPLPRDATFVATTLHLPRAGMRGDETAFDWRNPAFAAVFAEANRTNLVGGPDRVEEAESHDVPQA